MNETRPFDLALWMRNQGYGLKPPVEVKTTYTQYRVQGKGLRKYRDTEVKARALVEDLVFAGYETLAIDEIVRRRSDNTIISIKNIESVRPYYG